MGNEASRTTGDSTEGLNNKQPPRSPLKMIKRKALERKSLSTSNISNEKENVVPDSTVEGDPKIIDEKKEEMVQEIEKTEKTIDDLMIDSPCSDVPLENSEKEDSSQSDTSSAQKWELVNKDMVEDENHEPMEESTKEDFEQTNTITTRSSRASYNLRKQRALKQRYGRNSAAIQRGRKLKVITPRVRSKQNGSANQWNRKMRKGALLGLSTTTLINKEDKDKLFNPSKFAINGKFAFTLEQTKKEEKNKDMQINEDGDMDQLEEEKVDEILAEWEKEIASDVEKQEGENQGDDLCDIKDEGQMIQHLETNLESSHLNTSPSPSVSQASPYTVSLDQPDGKHTQYTPYYSAQMRSAGLIHRNKESMKKLSETELFQLHALVVVKEMAHFKGRQDWTTMLLDMENMFLS